MTSGCLRSAHRSLMCTKSAYRELITRSFKGRWWSSTPIKTKTNYKVVLPGNVSEQTNPNNIPSRIVMPPYALTGIPPPINEKVNT